MSRYYSEVRGRYYSYYSEVTKIFEFAVLPLRISMRCPWFLITQGKTTPTPVISKTNPGDWLGGYLGPEATLAQRLPWPRGYPGPEATLARRLPWPGGYTDPEAALTLRLPWHGGYLGAMENSWLQIFANRIFLAKLKHSFTDTFIECGWRAINTSNDQNQLNLVEANLWRWATRISELRSPAMSTTNRVVPGLCLVARKHLDGALESCAIWRVAITIVTGLDGIATARIHLSRIWIARNESFSCIGDDYYSYYCEVAKISMFTVFTSSKEIANNARHNRSNHR